MEFITKVTGPIGQLCVFFPIAITTLYPSIRIHGSYYTIDETLHGQIPLVGIDLYSPACLVYKQLKFYAILSIYAT